METTTPSPHDWKEWRRLRAWELKQQGWAQHDMSQDPLGFAAGDSNLYRYANNNPGSNSDPSGDEVFSTTPNGAAINGLRQWLKNGTGRLSQVPAFGDVAPGLDTEIDLVDGKRYLDYTDDAQLAAAEAKVLARPMGGNSQYVRQIFSALKSTTYNVNVTWVPDIKNIKVPHADSFLSESTKRWWTFQETDNYSSHIAGTFNSRFNNSDLATDEKLDLVDAVQRYRDEAATNWQQTIGDMGEVQTQIAVLRAEAEKESHKSAAQLKAVAPFLFEGPNQFKYFRPNYDANGDLSFVPTGQLRKLQIEQALHVGAFVTGNQDEASWYPQRGYSGQRNPFWVPQTADESMAWFAQFGTTSPTKLIAADVRASGALINSTLDLTAVIPAGTIMSAGRFGVMTLLNMAGKEIVKGLAAFAAVEKIADTFGPAGKIGVQIAPILIGILRRRLPRLRRGGITPVLQGQAGLRRAGIIQNTERIRSLTGAEFRVPDGFGPRGTDY